MQPRKRESRTSRRTNHTIAAWVVQNTLNRSMAQFTIRTMTTLNWIRNIILAIYSATIFGWCKNLDWICNAQKNTKKNNEIMYYYLCIWLQILYLYSYIQFVTAKQCICNWPTKLRAPRCTGQMQTTPSVNTSQPTMYTTHTHTHCAYIVHYPTSLRWHRNQFPATIAFGRRSRRRARSQSCSIVWIHSARYI